MPSWLKILSIAFIMSMIGLSLAPVTVQAAAPASTNPFQPKLQAFDVDEFTYRMSFRLSDATEVFLIRSRFGMTYLYQHHQPTVSQHFIWATVGFYYTKTMLGRSIIQNITFDTLAFYPLWKDIGGIYHDLLGDKPLFELTQSVSDGQMTGGNMLIDPHALSKYVHFFGGTLTITGLKLVLENGLEVILGDITIELIKHYNEDYPYPAEMQSDEALNYTSDSAYIIVTGSGTAPSIVLLDSVLGFILVGGTVTFVILIILHLKGRIRLPFYKLGRLVSRSNSVIE